MVRAFLIYGLGGAASRLAAVFLIPLYTRALTIEEYGLLELLLALQAGATLLSGLQSESAILRDYFVVREATARQRLVWNGLIISLGGSVLLVVCALVAVQAHLPAAQEITPHLALLLVLTFLAQVAGIQMVVLRCNEQAVRFSLFALLDLLLSATASVLFILALGMGVDGALLGMICGKAVTCAIAFPATFGWPPRSLSHRDFAGSMLAYAVPTIPSVMFNWAQTNGSRVLLGAFFALQDVALAGVAIRVASLFGFVVHSFRLAWEPHAFRKLDESAQEAVYDKALQVYLLIMFAAASVAMLAAPVLAAIFAPPGYAASAPLVGLFVVGQFWLGATSITTMGIHGARVTGQLTIVFGVGAIVNGAILLAFAPTIGILAAALGFVASTFACAAIGAVLSNRHFAARLSIWRLVGAFAVTTAAGLACWMISRAISLDALDGADLALRTAALAAVLTVCAAMLIAIVDRSTRIELVSHASGSLRAISRRLFRRPEA